MGKRAPLNPVQVFPSHGELYLRCGECGSMEFKVHVKPSPKLDEAHTTATECSKCKKVRKIDPRGFIEGSGKIEKLI